MFFLCLPCIKVQFSIQGSFSDLFLVSNECVVFKTGSLLFLTVGCDGAFVQVIAYEERLML